MKDNHNGDSRVKPLYRVVKKLIERSDAGKGLRLVNLNNNSLNLS
jgi:hypothetical protein